MKIRSLLILTLIFGVGTHAFATVGTITGKVIDKDTKEPLPWAQVIVSGITLGTVTDRNGHYTINNVPVGVHTVIVTMMGYASARSENVVVTSELPVRVNFELEKIPLDIGTEVIVEAERPIFRRDLTATVHSARGVDIEQMPVKSYQEVIELQPGVVAGHFRGGRKEEVLYLVDGIPIQDPTTGGPGSILPTSSIVAMTIWTGGFEAEYGKAMSGIVNLITREGGEKFQAKVWTTFDKFGGLFPTYDLVSSEDAQKYEVVFSGPISEKLRFFLSGNYQRDNTRFKDDMLKTFLPPIEQETDLIAKTTLRWSSACKLSIMGLFSYREWKEYEHRWKKRLEALPPYYTQSYRISATLTHTLSPYTFYNFALSHYNLFYQILGKHMHEYNPVCELNDDGYVIKGDKAYWEDNIQNISLIKADITSKRGTHQMKGGGEFIYYDLYMNSAYQVQMRTADPKFPIYLTYYTKYKYYPKSAAMYLQDKFRYEFFVIDLGLRFDYFDPCAQRPKIIEPTFGSWIIDLSDTVRASPKSQLSPRIGITFFSSNFSIRFNYGLFFQMPLFEYLYRNVNYDFSSGYPPVLGDPDLQAAKTEAMEAGVKRFLSKSTVVTATAFSKIASNLVDCITHYDPTEGTMDRVPVAGYNKYVSVEQANIKGIELDLQKIYGRLLTGRISYTYQTATAIFKMSEFAPELRHPLSWDQRHKLVLNLDLRQQDTWGVNILWEWNSPLPYTSRPEMPNMDRMWPRYRLDLKVEKIFYPMNKRLSVYLEVKNLLDKKMSCG